MRTNLPTALPILLCAESREAGCRLPYMDTPHETVVALVPATLSRNPSGQPNQYDPDGSGSAILRRKRAFLAAYQTSGKITDSADELGISRDTYYDWLATDPDFTAAIDSIHEWWTAKLRGRVLERSEKSDLLLMFEMKRRDPAYKDNWKIELNVSQQVAAGDWQAAIAALEDRK